MMKILHIVGNRPQFIKLAVLHDELRKYGISQQVVHTGQHYDFNMSDIFFNQLQIPKPDLNLQISNIAPGLFIGQAIQSLCNYFSTQKNSCVMVYGDTNTTMAAAIAAKKTALPLLHFESGVRTGDLSMPEEINRVVTDRLANFNYCCTSSNKLTLDNEGFGTAIPSLSILTGDLMLDAFITMEGADILPPIKGDYVLCTIHRQANLANKENLQNIFYALNLIHKNIPVVIPTHPHTAKKIKEYGIQSDCKLIEPVGYREMKTFLTKASYVITDSGGISREAYFLRKKSLIIMENPFWPEIVNQDCALHTMASSEAIFAKFKLLPALNSNFNTGIFGNGNAREKIREHICTII